MTGGWKVYLAALRKELNRADSASLDNETDVLFYLNQALKELQAAIQAAEAEKL